MSCDTGSYYFLFSFHFKKLPYLLIGRGEGKERGWGVKQTRSSWVNCALRDEEAVYWVSIGHYQAVAVGNR